METEQKQNRMGRSETVAIMGILVSLMISMGAGLISWGANSSKVDSLQSTVVGLNLVVTNLTKALQDTREEVVALRAQREEMFRSLGEIKATLNDVRINQGTKK